MLHLSKWGVAILQTIFIIYVVEKEASHDLFMCGKSGVLSISSSHSLIEYFFFFLKAVFTSFSDGSALTRMIYTF